MELIQLAASLSAADSTSDGRDLFRWGGSIAAIFLLILNRATIRSPTQTVLLVLFLFTSLPAALFNVLRGDFGSWVAMLAVGGNFFFPNLFPASRFLLFVVTPDPLASGVHETSIGPLICLFIVVFLVIMGIHRIDFNSPRCDLLCTCYWIGMFFMAFITLYYLACLWGGSSPL